jgi:hypothetical protein
VSQKEKSSAVASRTAAVNLLDHDKHKWLACADRDGAFQPTNHTSVRLCARSWAVSALLNLEEPNNRALVQRRFNRHRRYGNIIIQGYKQ